MLATIFIPVVWPVCGPLEDFLAANNMQSWLSDLRLRLAHRVRSHNCYSETWDMR